MERIKEPPTITTRPSATANLMVDSKDRKAGYWANFSIVKPQALLNGFFNRIGTTELVLEWFQPNIRAGSEEITVTIGGTDYTVNLDEGYYTAEAALNEVVALLNAAVPAGTLFAIGPVAGIQSLVLTVAGAPTGYDVGETLLGIKLDLYNPDYDGIPSRPIINPDIRPYRYIDFVSSQLTYNQDLKDSSTAPIPRDVLARWYFAYDQPNQVDGLGFPILMGYEPFVLRRTFNPPKQIRWDNIQPVGNLAFEVYDDLGGLIAEAGLDKTEWLMTLQVSEN